MLQTGAICSQSTVALFKVALGEGASSSLLAYASPSAALFLAPLITLLSISQCWKQPHCELNVKAACLVS